MAKLLKVLVLVPLLAVSGAAPAPEKEDLAALQGKWQATKLIKRGALLAPDKLARMSATFSNNKAIFESRTGKKSFSFKIDPTKKPKHIDLTPEDGPAKGQLIPGIYQLDGDSLLLCMPDDANRERPDALESRGGGAPSRTLFTLKRVKD